MCVSSATLLDLRPYISFLSSRIAFEGIGQFFEHLSGSEAKLIRLANGNGIGKVIRNILALQQSIKTLTRDTRGADFDRAKEYHTLFPGTRRCISYVENASQPLFAEPIH